jgi:predicted NBD/HSP70 family sugar kinase
MKVLGIDIGGTKINTVLWDGRIVKTKLVLTPNSRDKFLKVLMTLLAEYSVDTFDAIAVGFAGVVDSKKKKILNAPNIKFLNNYDLAKFLGQFSKNVSIVNDADCALYAEMTSGVLQGKSNAVLVAFGTGIGAGLMIDGRLYQGSGFAGEVGATILDNGKTAEELIGGKKLKDFGVKGYKPVVKYGAQLLGNLINTLNPEVVVLSGGVVHKAPKNFLFDLKKEVKKYINAPTAKNTPLKLASHGVNAVAVGAIKMVNV